MKNYINAFGGDGSIQARAFVIMNAFGLVNNADNECLVSVLDFSEDSSDYKKVRDVIQKYNDVAHYNLPFTCNIPISKSEHTLKKVVMKSFNNEDFENMSIDKIYKCNTPENKINMQGSFDESQIKEILRKGLYGNLRIGNTIYKKIEVENAFAQAGFYADYETYAKAGGLNIFSLGGFKGGGTGATFIPLETNCYNKYMDERGITRGKFKSYRITSLPYGKYSTNSNTNVKETLHEKYYIPKSANLLISRNEEEESLKTASQQNGYKLDAAIFVGGISETLDVTGVYSEDEQSSRLHGVNMLSALSIIQILNNELDETKLNGNPLLFNINFDNTDGCKKISYENLNKNSIEMQKKITNVIRFATVLKYILIPTFNLKNQDFENDVIVCNMFDIAKEKKGFFKKENKMSDAQAIMKIKMLSEFIKISSFYDDVISAIKEIQDMEYFPVEIINNNFITAYSSLANTKEEFTESMADQIRIDKLDNLESISNICGRECFKDNQFNGASVKREFEKSPKFKNICEKDIGEQTIVKKILEIVYDIISIN